MLWQKLKVKKAIEKGNTDGAQIYSENAICKRTEHMNYLRLASRIAPYAHDTRVPWGYNSSRTTMTTPLLPVSKVVVCKAPRCMVLASDERRRFDIGYANHHCELLPSLCYNHALFHGLVEILMLFEPWLSPCRLLCR
uniref:Uncharacterized protein n=2 Tax=Aegilops tauschii subsp. strangulata TaxID=200361 RepID=A0A453SWZ7_AEGTS